MTGSQGTVRLLVDASALADDSAYRGIGTYVRSLLAALEEISGLEVSGLAPAAAQLPAYVNRVTVQRSAPGRLRPLERELRLPVDLRRSQHEVFHSPGLDPPYFAPKPWVQTIHDVIPLVFDDATLITERRRMLRQAPRLRRAKRIVAISRHTAETAVSALGLDPSRVEIVPHGVDPRFSPGDGGSSTEDPYLLSVGEYSRRKGYPEAFAVIGELADRGHRHRLHVTGRIAPWIRETVDRLVAGSPRPERIVLRGFVDDLVGEYRGADALVMTSRYEGFGLPILEAMACGIPVVAFANSAVSEVVGDGGILVRDGDVRAMSVALDSVLRDRTRHAELQARGLAHAARFTWERSARLHAEIYRAAAASAAR